MTEETLVLRDVYATIAELWCSPADVDRDAIERDASATLAGWARLDAQGPTLLSQFLQDPLAEDQYVELFELAPQCSLYLGSHTFEEPDTCAKAAVSDRNGYMIELLGIYRHLGLVPNGQELPDYLPLVVEFLALSAESEDPIRDKLIQEYILPFLAPIRARLEALATPYVQLLDALEQVLRLDLNARVRDRSCLTTSSL